jgi:hypothetical protein
MSYDEEENLMVDEDGEGEIIDPLEEPSDEFNSDDYEEEDPDKDH